MGKISNRKSRRNKLLDLRKENGTMHFNDKLIVNEDKSFSLKELYKN
jgi:hypothetical protein